MNKKAKQLVFDLRRSGFVVSDAAEAGEVERYVGYRSQASPARWSLPVHKLALLDAALAHLLTFRCIDAAVLRSVTGILNWVFLLRRPLFSILHAVYIALQTHDDGVLIALTAGVRAELKCCRRLLVMVWADCHRLVAPIVFAQDAEGCNAEDLGGWGLGFAVPPVDQVVSLTSKCMAHGLPRDLSDDPRGEAFLGLSDLKIPNSWTDGTTRWVELLAGRHRFL